jgi:endoglucanase
VELALTTGDDVYFAALSDNPLWQRSTPVAPFDWKNVFSLGLIDLAMVDGDLDVAADAREKIVAAADDVLDAGAKSAFGHLYLPPSTRYEWGSNGLVLNTLVVVATAYDITAEQHYRDAVFEGMDYVLGRNGVDMSYITGYGTVASENQHHRWMAPSLDASLPPIPPGTLAGGANSSIQDPVAQRLWPGGCSGQLCYIDDIQSWSTNEMTINWNSALSWVAAWLAAEEAGDAVASSRAAGSGTAWWIGGGALALIAVSAVVLVLVRRRRTVSP